MTHATTYPAGIRMFWMLVLAPALVLWLMPGALAHAQDNTEDVGLEEVASGLTSPVALAQPDDGSDRLFIVDQVGLIHVVMPDGTVLDDPFLDLSDRLVDLMDSFDERGLLGLAFHPDYANNGRFFVYYSAPLRDEAPDNFNHTSHISEFTVSDQDANQADPNSERILLHVDQPQFNHNAGTLAFGADGYLYISLGDGGGANDTGENGNLVGHVEDWYEANAGGNGQDVTENLLGSILRLDVDDGDPYGIPADNPFVGTDGMDEIYAYGFRNPYRFSFDMDGELGLLVGDAGQNRWEEVSQVEQGGNYGWNIKEGAHCFDASNPDQDLADCPDVVGEGHIREGEPLIDPVIEYLNANQEGGVGLVVVGGYVYRGSAISGFEGRYIFGDWSTSFQEPAGLLFIATPQEEGMWAFDTLQVTDREGGALGHYVLGFGQDLQGEVYVLTTDMVGPSGNTGTVYQFVPAEDPTGLEQEDEIPEAFVLEQNYPNPFNPRTTIRFSTPEAGWVQLKIYDMLGREVATLVDEHLASGTYVTEWAGTDEAGQPVASGAYIYTMQTDTFTDARLLTLVK